MCHYSWVVQTPLDPHVASTKLVTLTAVLLQIARSALDLVP